MSVKRSRSWLLGAVAAALIAGGALSCAGEAPKSRDSGSPWVDTLPPDSAWLPPDMGRDVRAKDTYVWPDVSSPKDTWPWPTPDTYTGAPFGCETDEDCFGRLCCKTPWGVKVCAETCGP